MNKGLFSIIKIVKRRKEFLKDTIKKNRKNTIKRKYDIVSNQYLGELSNFISLEDLEKIRKYERIIPRVVVSVGNYCTLRCKECTQLVPYVKKRYYDDCMQIVRNVDNLLSNVDFLICVDIIGGEPFLYKELPKLVNELLKKKVGFIEITTNGTVLPSTEMLDSFAHERVRVNISDYGSLAKNRGKVVDLLEMHGIIYRVLPMNEWYEVGNDRVGEKRGLARGKYQYYHCWDNVQCRTITKGRLWICGRASGLDDCGIGTNSEDYISLEGDISWEQIETFFYDKDTSNACRYCGAYSYDFMKLIPVAEQYSN